MDPETEMALPDPRSEFTPHRDILHVAGGAMLAALLLFAGIEFGRIAWGTGVWVGRFSFKWGLAFGLFALFCILVMAGMIVLLWRPEKTRLLTAAMLGLRAGMRWLRWPLAVAAAGLPGFFLIYTLWGDVFSGPFLRLLLYLAASLLSAYLITNQEKALISWRAAGAGFLLAGCGIVLADALVTVRSYPFSLSWSEGNRLWDYSTSFGRHLYNFPQREEIFSYIDPGRQTLWGLPFLFPWNTILLTRLWSAFLFTVPYAVLGWIAFRYQHGSSALWLLAGLWVMLFLNQGPIYTPLVLSAILVAIAYRIRSLWLGVLLVLAASYYAQLSRFTWMFAPALWAGLLALGSAPTRDAKIQRRDWGRAIALMSAGVIGGFLLPKLSPGTPGGATTDVTDFTGLTDFITRQPLLWYRLLPNATYDIGILLGIFLAAGPLIALLAYLAATGRWALNRLQQLTVALPLLAFLIVGLVVSVKIGGGSNLHNLDMFLIGLIFAAALAWEAGAAGALAHLDEQYRPIRLLVLAIVALPALFPLMQAKPLILPSSEIAQSSLETIRAEIGQKSEQGEVLLMDQRQLLTFGQLQDLPLVDDYEKKYLMDQALSGDAPYFDTFYRDLAEGRFTLIVSHPIKVQYQGSEHNFGEENDAWSWWVARGILCYYEPLMTLKEVNVQLLVPRDIPDGDCPS
jgi:hypothetical protein